MRNFWHWQYAKKRFNLSVFILQLSMVVLTLILFSPAISVGEETETQPKSEKTALLWSIGSTVVPAVIGASGLVVANQMKVSDDGWFAAFGWTIGLGLMIGPSAGHWYAGEVGRGFRSFGLRGGIFGLGILTAGVVGIVCFQNSNCHNPYPLAGLLFGFGTGLISSGVYDIITAPESARIHNEKMKQKVGFYIQPIVNKGDYHLQVGVRF